MTNPGETSIVAASKQRRHAADRERPEHHLAIDEAQRHADRGLAFERRLADRAEARDDVGGGILARDLRQPRHDAVKPTDRRADAALRDDAIDIEGLKCLLEPDDRHLHLAVEAAAR